MSRAKPTIFIVDDDEAMRIRLQALIKSVGMMVEAYDSAEAFLESYNAREPACLLLDMFMPGMDGLELQKELAARRIDIPIIFLTAHSDVPMAVRAMREGAADFIEKPFRDQLLLDSIKHALRQEERSHQCRGECAVVESCLATLTAREREVLDLVVAGKFSKEIAAELGLSPKTIEFHRAKIMQKMQADSVADLVRMVLTVLSSWG